MYEKEYLYQMAVYLTDNREVRRFLEKRSENRRELLYSLSMVFVLLGILVLAAIVVVGVVVWKMRRNRLSAYVLEELQLRLTQALEHEDMHRRVLEGEKVIDHALKLLKYQGTFAEKLTEAQWRFSDPEALWSAHRIRNSIAHDLGITIQPRTIDYACKALSQALRDLS